MRIEAVPARPFAFVGDAKLARRFNAFAKAIEADSAAQHRLSPAAGYTTRVLSDIATGYRKDGRLRLRRFYWSVQRWRLGSPPEFAARTLSYYNKSGDAVWHSFPDDPGLAGAGQALARLRNPSYLRYVPLRRLTLRCADSSGAPVVAKLKRRNRFGAAISRLQLVNDALDGAPVSFAVPRLLEVDSDSAMFFQSLCAGISLAEVMRPETAGELLGRAGGILAELHELPVAGLTALSDAAILSLTRDAVIWLASLVPDCAGRLSVCMENLARYKPTEDNPVFCHGDFVCSQFLVNSGNWSLVDYDLIHSGSRYRDIAILLASLRSDVKCFSGGKVADENLSRALAAAEDAFVGTYFQQTGLRPDAARLHWHRAIAELHYLMLMVKKDSYEPATFLAGLDRAMEASQMAARWVESGR